WISANITTILTGNSVNGSGDIVGVHAISSIDDGVIISAAHYIGEIDVDGGDGKFTVKANSGLGGGAIKIYMGGNFLGTVFFRAGTQSFAPGSPLDII